MHFTVRVTTLATALAVALAACGGSSSSQESTADALRRYHRVSVSVTPSSDSLPTGSQQQFAATVSNASNTSVVWTIQEGTAGGSVTSAGVYTAPSSTGTFHVVATSVADSTKSAAATVTVTAPATVAVTVTPTSASLSTGGTQQFTAGVTGTTNTAVSWTVQEGAAGGSVSSAGLYSAPSTAGTYHVVATSQADPTRSATATVTVASPLAVAVAVIPSSVTLAPTGTQAFTATVTNTTNTAVTWTVQEGALGGTISSAGAYTAPSTAGTYHVVATSQADGTKKATATVTVTAPAAVAVSVLPTTAGLTFGGTQQFNATVTNTTNPGVTWTVQEGAAGGAISSTGLYTAPSTAGTYHVVATSQADSTKTAVATVTVTAPSTGGTYALPADRPTKWQPGVTYNGGIPARTTTYNPGGLNPSGGDDTSAIQALLDGCPAGQVVQLNAGTFHVNGNSALTIHRGITVRGAGAGTTILARTANGNETMGANINGIGIFNSGGAGSIAGYTNIQGTANKGDYSVQVSGAGIASLVSGWNAGTVKYVLVDMVSGATNVPDPQNFAHGDGVFSTNMVGGATYVWRSPDSEVFWPDRDSSFSIPWYYGIYFRQNTATDGNDARPQGEIKEIQSITGSGPYTITFKTPLHHWFNQTRLGQVAWWSSPFLEGVGIENLTVYGGGMGNIWFAGTAKSWLKNVESYQYVNPGIKFVASYQMEIRDSYIHDSGYPYSGGGGYAIALDYYVSELLLENNIIIRVEKPMVFRSAGAGSVVAYNYVDDVFEGSNPAWMEVGINGSHMVGGYRTLFEGNWSQNFDSDKRWGGSTYMTVFRNLLRGHNEKTFTWNGTTITESSGFGPGRAAGSQAWGYWHSFVGNVLGKAGAMSGFSYETTAGIFQTGIWSLGWDDVSPYGGNTNDPMVTQTALRVGNFDYLTNQQRTHTLGTGIGDTTYTQGVPAPLPNSLYLSSKPSFFGANTWPWVEPGGSTKTYTLPAKARYDAGTPNVVP